MKHMCPNCYKGMLEQKSDLSKIHLICPRCDEEFVKTGKFSVRFKDKPTS